MTDKKEQAPKQPEQDTPKDKDQQDGTEKALPEMKPSDAHDPHRGTADTPPQHQEIMPGGGDADEYFDDDGELDEEVDDLDDEADPDEEEDDLDGEADPDEKEDDEKENN